MSALVREVTVPAQGGRAVEASAGEAVEVVDLDGHQVGDLWVIDAGDHRRWLSPSHTRDRTERLFPGLGQAFTNQRGEPTPAGRFRHAPHGPRRDCRAHSLCHRLLAHQQPAPQPDAGTPAHHHRELMKLVPVDFVSTRDRATAVRSGIALRHASQGMAAGWKRALAGVTTGAIGVAIPFVVMFVFPAP